MRRIFSAAAALLVAGCTPMQWHKQDVSAEQFLRDEQECRQSAWREAGLRSWQYQTAVGPVFTPNPGGGGFIIWPSGAVVDPYGYQLVEENRLAQFCMESKGYELVPKK